MAQISDAFVQQMLLGRYIAALGTENPDGSIHMVSVWYLYDGENIYVATSSRTRKAQNVAERSKVSVMIDARDTAAQRGITIMGTARVLTGPQASERNAKIHHKYLSAAAIADPNVGPVFAQFDDITIRIAPHSVIAWDMREIDRQFFAGAFKNHPEYFLPIED